MNVPEKATRRIQNRAQGAGVQLHDYIDTAHLYIQGCAADVHTHTHTCSTHMQHTCSTQLHSRQPALLGALTIPAPAARTPVQRLPKKGAPLMAALMMPAMVLAGTGGAAGSSSTGKCFSLPNGKRYPQTLLSFSRGSCVLLGWLKP